MADDPFAPIDGGRGKPKLRVVADAKGVSIVAPVPVDAPGRPDKHPKLGAPSATWTYLDAAGAILGYVLRFDDATGKEFRPLALWRNERIGALEWRWAMWPDPRPLYGLDRLATRPGAHVVLCEGEKAADAAQRLMPDFVAVASPNGAKSARKADWSALRGRAVTIWPDADAPGAAYAKEASGLAFAAGAASVAIAEPPADVDEGFDAADAEAEGWSRAEAERLILAAQAASIAPAPRRRGTKKDDDPPRKRGVGAIVELVDDVEFWHGPDKTAYASFRTKDHRENCALSSKEFARFVAARAYAQGVTPPSSSTLADALRVLEARALNDGPLKKPFRRVGMRDGLWYLDLGDPRWRVVEIRPAGWSILEDHDLPMVRSTAMCELPEPARLNNGVETLKPFVNSHDDAFKLVVAWLLSALAPRGPYPVLILNGEQGSAKSTLSKLLRNLVDPNIAPLRAMPKDETDLLVSATHSHVVAIDNISKVSAEMSDAICRIATGGGLASRAKFTDGDEFVVYTRNPVILNGIPSLASRPDLASRAIVIHLDPIPDERRKTEEEQEAAWAEAFPLVLGGLLDALTCALNNIANVKLARAARMADFEKLIEAASPALEWASGEFSRIYLDNQAELDSAAIESDVVASAILSLVRDDHPGGWSGTASRLLELLAQKVNETIRRSRDWPASPISLGNRLARIGPVLRRNGVLVSRKHSGERVITIAPIKTEPAGATSPA
ncbi:ATP-binding protein [Methylosinus sp. KRF6]|uniref:ATP-binding protein n=1 Tax=Methylosinus sp. KRF6 TaxID=2846853 RepID=UPI001C0B619B|nr:ATP-binding protein [Methylosinus sp. KRF6]MBU3887218.1 ATP-binding protein [Methylosinus sp. KRF6]